MADELHLPRAGDAIVPIEKLRDYALSPDHPRGQHKARVFRSVLGIGQDDWQFLRDQVLELVAYTPVAAVSTAGPYGTTYTVILPIEGLNGATQLVATIWIVAEDEAPRLTTLYVNVP